MNVLTKDGWSTRADWRFRSAGRRGRVHHRHGGRQPAGHRVLRLGPLSQDTRPLHGGAGLPPAPALRGPGRAGAGVREPIRRPADRHGGGAAVLLAHFLATAFASRRRTATSGCSGSSTAARTRRTPSPAAIPWCAASAAWALQEIVGRLRPAGVPGPGAARRLPSGGSRPAVSQLGHRRLRPLSRLEPGAAFWSPRASPGSPARRTSISARPSGRGRISRPRPSATSATASRRWSPPGSGRKLPGGFGFLEALAGGLYTSAGLDSGVVQLAATGVTKPVPGHVAIAPRGSRLDQESAARAPSSTSGLGTGPRAFRSHAFTGDRTVFATAEYRVTVAEDFLGLVGLGIAGFVDHGGAWYAGTPRRLGWDAGLGLRLGASRATTPRRCGSTWRAASGTTRRRRGWVVTVGKGFVFSPVGKRAL